MRAFAGTAWVLLVGLVAVWATAPERRQNVARYGPRLRDVPRVLLNDSGAATTIAFGSCSKHDRPQPLWELIADDNPDVFVFLGDVVYADRRKGLLRWTSNAPEVMAERFDAQLARADYAALLSRIPVVGVWDDHDYGINNGGASFAGRDTSQELFLDFIGEPKRSARRAQRGVYASYRIGPPGKRVLLLLLDVRYHRDDPPSVLRGARADILGAAQWDWVERELARGDHDLVVVGSGIQVLPRDKVLVERWSVYHDARERLLRKLLRQSAPFVFLSGDIHIGELSEMQCGSRRVVEATSSGMTHSWGNIFGRMWPYLEMLIPCEMRRGARFGGLNYGLLHIDWERQEMDVEIKGIGVYGESPVRIRVPFAQAGGEPEGVLGCVPSPDTALWERAFPRVFLALVCLGPLYAIIRVSYAILSSMKRGKAKLS